MRYSGFTRNLQKRKSLDRTYRIVYDRLRTNVLDTEVYHEQRYKERS